jgi:hypothetical protein
VKKYSLIFLLSVLLLQTGCSGVSSSQSSKEVLKVDVSKTDKVKKYTYLRFPYNTVQEPVLLGDDLYMAANVNDSPSITNQILKYNLKTKKTTKIFESQFEVSSIHTVIGNQDWLVWVDSDDFGVRNRMWAKNLKTGETQVLSESKDDLVTFDSPALYQDYVAWTYVDEKKETTVRLVNLKTQENKVVHCLQTYSLANAFLHMNQGKLVWSDEINKVPHYMVYDLSTKQVQSYKAPGYFPGYVQLVGDQIFSVNSNDHFFHAGKVWTGIFDIKTGQATRLINRFANNLTGFDNYIAYVDDGIKDSRHKLAVFKVKNGTLKKIIVDTHPLFNPDFFRFSSNHVLIVASDVPEGNRTIATDILFVQL